MPLGLEIGFDDDDEDDDDKADVDPDQDYWCIARGGVSGCTLINMPNLSFLCYRCAW